VPKRDEGAKCVVCGCTDEHGCDEGCEWTLRDPPVCSSCVARYLIAKLWGVVFSVESKVSKEAASAIEDVRKIYGLVGKEMAERYGLPTLKQVCQINRNVTKFTAPPAGYSSPALARCGHCDNAIVIPAGQKRVKCSLKTCGRFVYRQEGARRGK
jgi:hypothetical protein